MMRSLKLAVTAAAIGLAPFAAEAATDFSFTNLTGAEYDTAGVFVKGTVNFTGTTDDGSGLDQVLFQLYDDQEVKFEQTYEIAVGEIGSFDFEAFYAGLVGQGARGVGLYLTDLPDGGIVSSIDPYDVPHYADPSQCQRDCGPVGPAVPEPSSWAMMIGGVGSVGALFRRRSSAWRAPRVAETTALA